jgi:6-phosphogluconolactonase (cycloisomerase 2 family)
VYAASHLSDAVVVLDRNPQTGGLTQRPESDPSVCISEIVATGCQAGAGLNGAFSIAVSSDGNHIYAASFESDAVAMLNRNSSTDGLIQPVSNNGGCISSNPTEVNCQIGGRGLNGAFSVAVSGDSVYVAAQGSNAIAIFGYDSTSGVLGQRVGSNGCISSAATENCNSGRALNGARSVTVSPDGSKVYVASYLSDAVVMLDRDQNGDLTQRAGVAGCISNSGSDGANGLCQYGRTLDGARWVTSPDNQSVLATSADDVSAVSGAISVFGVAN